MHVRWLTLSGWNCFRVGKDGGCTGETAFIVECMRTIAWPDFGASWKEKQAAVKAMKFYGRQSADQRSKCWAGSMIFLNSCRRPKGRKYIMI